MIQAHLVLDGWVDVPFDIPNLRVENGPAKAHVRIGWLTVGGQHLPCVCHPVVHR